MSHDKCQVNDIDGVLVMVWDGDTGVTLISRELMAEIVEQLNELRRMKAVASDE
jgi:hypothetical protein